MRKTKEFDKKNIFGFILFAVIELSTSLSVPSKLFSAPLNDTRLDYTIYM